MELNIKTNDLFNDQINLRELNPTELTVYLSSASDPQKAVTSFISSPSQNINDSKISMLLNFIDREMRYSTELGRTINYLMGHDEAKKEAYSTYARLSLKNTSMFSLPNQLEAAVKNRDFPNYILHLQHSRILTHVEFTEMAITHYTLTKDTKTSLSILDKALKIYDPTAGGKSSWSFSQDIKKRFEYLIARSDESHEPYNELRVKFAARLYCFIQKSSLYTWWKTDWSEIKNSISGETLQKIFATDEVSPIFLAQIFDEAYEEEAKEIAEGAIEGKYGEDLL